MKAILTGHSRGLGAAICETLLARAIPVLAIARNLNADLAQRFPELQQVALDLADLEALAHWLQGHAVSSFLAGSRTALLINNAGVVAPVGPLPAQQVEDVARAVSINVAGPLMLSAAFAAAAPAGADKRILHVSSGAARSAYPGWSVYCATKAALDQHARAATMDEVSRLRICSLAPGVIDTDMQAEIRATPLDRFPIRERFDALKQDGGLAAPAACAGRLVAYLLDERFGHTPVADLREL